MIKLFYIFFIVMTCPWTASADTARHSRIKLNCDRLLYSGAMLAISKVPFPAGKKIAYWHSRSDKLVMDGFAMSDDGDVPMPVQHSILATAKQWSGVFESYLQQLQIFGGLATRGEEFAGFIIKRDNLLVSHPELASLLPPEYELILNPFRLVSKGWGTYVNQHDKVIGLPMGVLDRVVSAEDLHLLLHENVHIRLQLTREREKNERFAFYYAPQGPFVEALLPFFGLYTKLFKSEESIANIVTAAAHLDALCTKGFEVSLSHRFSYDLERAYNTSLGVAQLLGPLVRRHHGNSVPYELGAGDESGAFKLEWLKGEMNIYVPTNNVSGLSTNFVARVHSNILDEERTLGRLAAILRPFLNGHLNHDGTVSMPSLSPAEIEKFCPLRENLWHFISQIDPTLLDLRKR